MKISTAKNNMLKDDNKLSTFRLVKHWQSGRQHNKLHEGEAPFALQLSGLYYNFGYGFRIRSADNFL